MDRDDAFPAGAHDTHPLAGEARPDLRPDGRPTVRADHFVDGDRDVLEHPVELGELRFDAVRARCLTGRGRNVRPVRRHRLVEQVELSRDPSVELFDGFALTGGEPFDDARNCWLSHDFPSLAVIAGFAGAVVRAVVRDKAADIGGYSGGTPSGGVPPL
ncbi:hypothetical protein GCM10010185_68770 [Saccharothrix coeruleofusca]|uniref:Uncharacterized protein n=1 Tax=Saccharothrix coeruleofusca TaxID=33919 RepID=A0A918EGX6_9PSEU|nr:hypothetical protein GCM10010185_68770 [Saccharothrix coeruleofusca]